MAVAEATPVLSWLTAWAIQQSALNQVAQRRCPNQSRWLRTSLLSWLTVFDFQAPVGLYLDPPLDDPVLSRLMLALGTLALRHDAGAATPT